MGFQNLVLVNTMRFVDENCDERVANHCVCWRGGVEQKKGEYFIRFNSRASYSRYERSKFEIDGSNDLVFDVCCYINDRQYTFVCDMSIERKTLQNIRQTMMMRKNSVCCSVEHPIYEIDGKARIVVDFIMMNKCMFVSGVDLHVNMDTADKWFEFNRRDHDARNKGFDSVVEISVVKNQ